MAHTASRANARWRKSTSSWRFSTHCTFLHAQQRKDDMEKTSSCPPNCHFGRSGKLAPCDTVEVQKMSVPQMRFFVCCLTASVQMTQLMIASAQHREGPQLCVVLKCSADVTAPLRATRVLLRGAKSHSLGIVLANCCCSDGILFFLHLHFDFASNLLVHMLDALWSATLFVKHPTPRAAGTPRLTLAPTAVSSLRPGDSLLAHLFFSTTIAGPSQLLLCTTRSTDHTACRLPASSAHL